MADPREKGDKKSDPSPRPLRRYTDRDQLAPQGYPPGKRPQPKSPERNKDGNGTQAR